MRSILREHAIDLTGQDRDYDPLMDLIGNARFVLIGEATHGTHEFYRRRADLTRRLIEEKGFTAVVAEADWPDAYRVNRYVRGVGDDASATDALGEFQRFPQWMWRNGDVLEFVHWLRDHNGSRPRGSVKAGFYGMDLYSLYTSAEAVLKYLDRIDPEAAKRARYRYGCFEQFNEDPQTYGYVASFNLERSCEDEVVRQLAEMRRRAGEYAKRDGQIAEDEYFQAEQNARIVASAERYYRAMFGERINTWNLRDEHMVETVERLVNHLDRFHPANKVVLWAHNSHLGDARATEMGQRGELNVGQLCRQKWGREAVLIGFSTYSGSVTAASDWGGPAERKRVRPGLRGSFEELFHNAFDGTDAMLVLRDDRQLAEALRPPRLQRAIGVIYRPEAERWSHYFEADLPRQFDAMLHIDQTNAIEPLEREPLWKEADVPETYPTGV